MAIAASLHFAASLPVWPHSENVPYPMLIEFDIGENPLRDMLAQVADQIRERRACRPDRARPGIEINEGAAKNFAIAA